MTAVASYPRDEVQEKAMADSDLAASPESPLASQVKEKQNDRAKEARQMHYMPGYSQMPGQRVQLSAR